MSRTLSEISPEFNAGFGVSSQWTSWSAAFFALTGVLIATALLNIGNSGIAFFYIVFLLPALALTAPDRWLTRQFDPGFVGLVGLLSICVAALFVTTWLQVVVYDRDPASDMVHLWGRVSFLAYFAVLLVFLKGDLLWKTMIWTRRLLIIVLAYGIYQLPAKLLGLPLFLDWLRNNKSFSQYAYDEAGWIGIVRSTSIFAEPSQATVPIIVLFILNLDRRISLRYRRLAWIILLLFTIASFSRTAWLCLVVGAASWFFCKRRSLRDWIAAHRNTVLVVILLMLVVLPIWGTLFNNYSSYSQDLSALERTQSISLGMRMIKDAPLLGYGWNSFHEASGKYLAFPVNSAIDFEFIHNMVVSYVQQAGLAGLLLSALPFIIIVRKSTAPTWITLTTATTFLIAAEFGGDLEYSSIVWLWLAILVNWSSLPALFAEDGQSAPGAQTAR